MFFRILNISETIGSVDVVHFYNRIAFFITEGEVIINSDLIQFFKIIKHLQFYLSF